MKTSTLGNCHEHEETYSNILFFWGNVSNVKVFTLDAYFGRYFLRRVKLGIFLDKKGVGCIRKI